MVFLLPQTELGDHESNAKPSAYVIFSCTIQQLWSMSGKKKRDGGLIQGWGFASVYGRRTREGGSERC